MSLDSGDILAHTGFRSAGWEKRSYTADKVDKGQRMRALLLLALSLACATVAAQPILHLETEDDPPHNMLRDGKVVGTSTEKLREAFKRAGAALEVELVPWARAYDYALRAH